MRSLGATHGAQFRSVSGRSYFKKRKGEQVSSYHRDGACDRLWHRGIQSSAYASPLGGSAELFPMQATRCAGLVVPRAASRRIRVRGENCNRLSAAGHSRLKLVEPFHLLDLQSAKRLPPPMTCDLAHVDLAG